MSNKMLIDAIHPEETRVVVLREKRVEDFDFEAASRKPLRGNIYLAKVTRVEPALQAAFIEYGGNKHGFLAFSEIHPDYYQIPQADRQALIDEMEEEEAPEAAKPKRTSSRRKPAAKTAKSARSGSSRSAEKADEPQDAETPVEDAAPEGAVAAASASDTDSVSAELDAAPEAVAAPAEPTEETDGEAPAPADAPESAAEAAAPEASEAETASAPTEADAAETQPTEAQAEAADAPAASAEPAEGESVAPAEEAPAKPKRRRRTPTTKKSDDGLADPMVSDTDDDEANEVTAIGEADAMEEIPERRRRTPKKTYKIQEVIKRRQILLVQVVKEERGNKGAALTTYLSLAGRYSVLMPNTNRGGGVSRKITDTADRKRLKSLVSELEVPEGMGIILRTAGAARTKTEIKRDFEYLIRLWESVRDLTLKSIAPELVYEEGNLVKRAIRDLYSKEIDEILVSGEAAYREAKDFMKMLMPSHAKNVKPYREPTPIFTAYAVEAQLDAMFSPTVTLPSKGSIVINPTEALVAIDVNSGRSTKESNIEDTATKTNLEAADEVARQLRLRDLAGLIVIDFIDMDDKRHNRQVEKRLKDALKMDRSRIQVGHISPFGLMEMSRQRIRQGMVETSMVTCPSCGGTGHVRSTQSVALYCLRALEEHLLKKSDNHITIRTSSAVALYILNQKRAHLNALEQRFGLEIGVHADEQLSGQHMEIVTGAPVVRSLDAAPPVAQIAPDAVSIEDDEDESDIVEAQDSENDGENGAGGERSSSSRRRRRRRRRGGGESNAQDSVEASDAAPAEALAAAEPVEASEREDDDGSDDADGDSEESRRSRRRRGRRGGRRHRKEGDEFVATGDTEERGEAGETEDADADAPMMNGAEVSAEPAEGGADAPVPAQPIEIEIKSGRPDDETSPAAAQAPEEASAAADAEEARAAEDADETESASEAVATSETAPEEAAASEPETAPEAASEPRTRRVGWWQRRSFF